MILQQQFQIEIPAFMLGMFIMICITTILLGLVYKYGYLERDSKNNTKK